MANTMLNVGRAAVGQGLGMGWGDEAEAWLRSRVSGQDYNAVLGQIRDEYAQFSKENPVSSTALEFGGGVLPGVAAMFLPGGQAAGATQIARTGAGALARLAASPLAKAGATGAVTGAVSGAGSAVEGGRGTGAATGAVLGGGLGVGLPVAMRVGKGALGWVRDRFMPSAALVEQRAAEKMNRALAESSLTPQDVQARLAADRRMKVPSVVANADPALADLAETVAQRTGSSARRVERGLTEQKLGSRERIYQKTTKALGKGDFYGGEKQLVDDLRKQADTLYETAYAHGSVNDPRINEVLKNPTFKSFYDKAKDIAETEAMAAKLRGEDPSKYQLKEIYKLNVDPKTQVMTPELIEVPDVRTLDYVKRGMDATIDSLYSNGRSAEANALKDLRRVFVTSIDDNVPAYKAARGKYAGDMEVLDAMRAGMNEFNKLDHEEVIKLVSKMSDTEKEAFRTGVVRNIYGMIMNPSGNINAAQRIIGAPEMQAKLQPLFESPAKFRLFRAALERESQLFQQANKILGGSPTGKRGQMRDVLEGGPGVGEVVGQAITGGWTSSLANLAQRFVRSASLTDEVADKLATMLMSKNPQEVAAVVKILETQAQAAVPKAARATAAELGAVTGTTAAIHPAPGAKLTEEETDIEAARPSSVTIQGPDIDADLEAERSARK